MSGTTSFLFQGQPTPPQPTGSDTATAYPLWLQQYTANIANAATNLAQQPYSQFPGPQVAAPSAATQQAWQQAQSNQGNFQPYINQGYNYTQQASLPTNVPGVSTPSTISSPWLAGSQINQYMSPYMGTVIGGLESASNQNFFQNVMPQIQGQFVSAGQAASPQQMEADNRAAYLQSQALGQNISQALQGGYTGALQTAQQQQGQALQTQLQQQGLGVGIGEFNAQQALQQAQGNRSALLQAGAQAGTLGTLQQQLSSANLGQLAAAGQGQDVVNQANINAALNNFYSQQQWPYQNLGYASNIIRGLPVQTNQQTVGLNYNPSQTYSSSPLASFIGGSMAGNALTSNANNQGVLSAFGLKKGGSVGALRRASGGAANDNERDGALVRRRRFDGGGSADAVNTSNPIQQANWSTGMVPYLSPGTTGYSTPKDFTAVSQSSLPSWANNTYGKLMNDLNYAYGGTGGSTNPVDFSGSQIGTFTMNGQTNYGVQTPIGFQPITHPENLPSVEQDPYYYGLALAGSPVIGGTNKVPVGSQEWSIDPNSGVASPSSVATSQAKAADIANRNSGNAGLLVGLGSLGALAGGALAAGIAGAGAAGAGAAEAGAASAGVDPLTGASLADLGIDPATGAVAGAAPALPPAAATTAGGGTGLLGQLGSILKNPYVQGAQYGLTAGQMLQNLTGGATGRYGGTAPTQQLASSGTQPAQPYNPYNSSFGATPYQSFYGRRGGRVPGALMRRKLAA